MHWSVIKSNFFLLLIGVLSCRTANFSNPAAIPADVILVVEQPFRDSEYLALVRVVDIEKCYAVGGCSKLKEKDNLIAHFVFSHKATDNNLNFKALKEHFPGVQPGNRIKAYCIAEQQKHGEYLLKVYQYTVL